MSDDVKRVVFKPNNEKQRKFIASKAREILYSGAVGAGKSFAICQKGHLLNLLYPGNKGILVRKQNVAVTKTTVVTLLEEVLPKDHIVSINWSKGYVQHRTGAYDDEGQEILSEIHWAGLDKGAGQDYPTKILSTQWGWVGFDETIEGTEKDWEVLMTRLRYKPPYLTPEQNDKMPRQIFGATNPDGPNHWLYERFFENSNDERIVVLATPYDNPFLPKDYISQLEDNLTGLTRERLLYGKWVQAEGVIYKDFDYQKHVIDKEELLPYKDYKGFVLGADSNYPLPRASVLIGLRGDGGADVIDEFYQEGAHVEDLRDWVQEWAGLLKSNLTVYHDPSDPAAISKLRGRGVVAMKADNKVVPGISTVASYISNDRLRIVSHCRNLIKFLQVYKWDKEREGDRPVKEDDHICNALRYALHSLKSSRGHRPAISF